MQIDLSWLRGVRVETTTRRAYVEGGSLLGELDHEAMAHGLVTTAGTVSHTGVGGLTLGGGFGRVARRFGLALDNVKAVDIVTADGSSAMRVRRRIPTCTRRSRRRRQFGIVTGFESACIRCSGDHRRQPGLPDRAGPRASRVLREFANSAPDELYCDAGMDSPMGSKPGTFIIQTTYSGPAADAERFCAVAKLGKPIEDTIKAQDYVAIQRSWDTTDARTTAKTSSPLYGRLPGRPG